MKKTISIKRSLDRIESPSDWILVHEQFNGDEIHIKKDHIEAVERLRSSYDGRPAGSTAYYKEICKIHTYGGKTFGVKENHKDIMNILNS